MEELIEKYCDNSDESFTCEPIVQKNTNLVDEKVSQLVRHQLENRLTYTSMVGTAQLMNGMPGAEIIMPDTKYKILNRVSAAVPPEYYIICKCENLVKNRQKCDRCQYTPKKCSKTNNFIAYIPVIPQIKEVLNKHLDVVIDYLERNHEIKI